MSGRCFGIPISSFVSRKSITGCPFLGAQQRIIYEKSKIMCRYHKDPNETTEWEDILAERGIVPRKKVWMKKLS